MLNESFLKEIRRGNVQFKSFFDYCAPDGFNWLTVTPKISEERLTEIIKRNKARKFRTVKPKRILTRAEIIKE